MCNLLCVLIHQWLQVNLQPPSPGKCVIGSASHESVLCRELRVLAGGGGRSASAPREPLLRCSTTSPAQVTHHRLYLLQSWSFRGLITKVIWFIITMASVTIRRLNLWVRWLLFITLVSVKIKADFKLLSIYKCVYFMMTASSRAVRSTARGRRRPSCSTMDSWLRSGWRS